MDISFPLCHPPELGEWPGVRKQEGTKPHIPDVLALYKPRLAKLVALGRYGADIPGLPNYGALTVVNGGAASAHSGTPEHIFLIAVGHPERKDLTNLSFEP